MIELYRAVKPEELEQILKTNSFENPLGIEVKYFSTSSKGALQYAEMAEKAFGDPSYTIIKTTFSKNNISEIMRANVDSGINAVTITTNKLNDLSKPEIIERELLKRRMYDKS